MSDYQVLFSGEVAKGSDLEAVRARLARELGIDERKARALFSGRTVVIRSQLVEGEAQKLQQRLADLGALCWIKSLAAPRAPTIDKHALRMEGQSDQTLKDITAAHVECPRCGHLQLEASHCNQCGVDIAAATSQKRKEDLLIEKKIRALREGQPGAARSGAALAGEARPPAVAAAKDAAPERKRGFISDLFRRNR